MQAGRREIAEPFANCGELHRLAGRAKTLIGFGGQSAGRLVAQKLTRLIARREIVKAFPRYSDTFSLAGYK